MCIYLLCIVIVQCNIKDCAICDTENSCMECNTGLVRDSTGSSCIAEDGVSDTLSDDAVTGIAVGKSCIVDN